MENKMKRRDKKRAGQRAGEEIDRARWSYTGVPIWLERPGKRRKNMPILQLKAVVEIPFVALHHHSGNASLHNSSVLV